MKNNKKAEMEVMMPKDISMKITISEEEEDALLNFEYFYLRNDKPNEITNV